MNDVVMLKEKKKLLGLHLMVVKTISLMRKTMVNEVLRYLYLYGELLEMIRLRVVVFEEPLQLPLAYSIILKEKLQIQDNQQQKPRARMVQHLHFYIDSAMRNSFQFLQVILIRQKLFFSVLFFYFDTMF